MPRPRAAADSVAALAYADFTRAHGRRDETRASGNFRAPHIPAEATARLRPMPSKQMVGLTTGPNVVGRSTGISAGVEANWPGCHPDRRLCGRARMRQPACGGWSPFTVRRPGRLAL